MRSDSKLHSGSGTHVQLLPTDQFDKLKGITQIFENARIL